VKKNNNYTSIKEISKNRNRNRNIITEKAKKEG